MKDFALDALDLKLLECLQCDASLSNQALAKRMHISAPTCMRRVLRLYELGVIERQIAVVNPEKLAQAIGFGLTAVVEVTLERQDVQALARFEAQAQRESRVSQCYRVSPGPDFCLIVHALDMPDYQQLCQRLFTQDANVRNVKTYFSVYRSKFGTALPLWRTGQPGQER